MKFHTRRLLSLLLMLSLFVSLLSVGAYAVDVPEITCELGTALDYTIPLEGDDSADGYEIVGGSLPSGLTVELKDGAVKLVGTPDAGGDYSCTIKITGASGAEAEYVLTIKVIDPFVATGVKLSKSGTLKMKKGATKRLYAKLVPDTAVGTLTWKTSNSSIAAVDSDGNVTAKKKGTCYVGAIADNGVYKTVKIKVS